MSEREVPAVQEESDKVFWRILNAIYLGLVFVIAWLFVSMQVSGLVASDTGLHMSYIAEIVGGKTYTHPLWHYGVHLLSRLLGVNYGIAVPLFTAGLITFYAYLI
jgi:hypothetical protein